MKNQYDILQEIQHCGYNVVTCGNCGDVVLIELKEGDVQCPHCDYVGGQCDYPDLYHEPYDRTKQ